MVMKGDLTWGVEHTIQYTDDVLQDYTPENYIILLTNVTLVSPIKIKINKMALQSPTRAIIAFKKQNLLCL